MRKSHNLSKQAKLNPLKFLSKVNIRYNINHCKSTTYVTSLNKFYSTFTPGSFLGWGLFFIIFLSLSGHTLASDIDLNRIMLIESSGNCLAYNVKSGARGLYQITPICLKDYNQYHKQKYTLAQLFIPSINEKIARWYLTKRIPQMLRVLGKPVTLENILISYNAGIGYVGKSLPKETRDYIEKYKEAK